MRHLRLALAAAPALLAVAAAPARADGPPGTCDCAAPAVVVAAPAPALPRWSVGLRLSSLSVAPADAPEGAQPDAFGGGGIGVRYRLRPRWELELISEHVHEAARDGIEGTASIESGTFAARFHPRPYARWDWFVLAGVGGSHLTDEATGLDEQRGHVAIGGGVERRWGHLGLAAELRLVGMGPAEPTDAMAAPAAAMTVPVADDGGEDAGLSGGQLTVAASYHF